MSHLGLRAVRRWAWGAILFVSAATSCGGKAARQGGSRSDGGGASTGGLSVLVSTGGQTGDGGSMCGAGACGGSAAGGSPSAVGSMGGALGGAFSDDNFAWSCGYVSSDGSYSCLENYNPDLLGCGLPVPGTEQILSGGRCPTDNLLGYCIESDRPLIWFAYDDGDTDIDTVQQRCEQSGTFVRVNE